MAAPYPVPWFTPTASDPCFCLSGKAFGDCCGARTANRKPPGGVQVFPGFLSPDKSRNWVKRLERQPRVRATVRQLRGGSMVSVEDPRRNCHNVRPGVLRKMINNRISDAFKQAAQVTGRSIAWYETPNILRYQSGGYYQRHADSCLVDPASNTWFKTSDRDLSLLLYLNEDFTGGGLSFINFNYQYRPRAGEVVIFPSDNRYEHRAEVVNSGVRYAIVSWAAFTNNPRVCDKPPDEAIHVSASSPS